MDSRAEAKQIPARKRKGKTMTSHNQHCPSRPTAATQRGLTLIELMVSLTIGLIMIGAIGMLFIGSSSARREVQSSADAFENARYATDLLTRELSLAGFYGAWTNPEGDAVTGIPCSNSPGAWESSMAIHVRGWNQDDEGPDCLPDDYKPQTDVIFIQRVSTCEAGFGGCDDATPDQAYIQVAECIDEANEDPKLGRIAGGDSPPAEGASEGEETPVSFTLKTKACGVETARLRQFIRRLYYVNQDDVLSYVEIGPTGTTTVELVENIEQVQLRYAVDTTGEGSPDQFMLPADISAAQWPNVVGVRLWLLARSETESDRRPADLEQVFVLDDMPTEGIDLSQAYRRSVASTYISFVSPTLRRAK